MKKCNMSGCEGKYHAKGFCKNHYRKVFGLNKKRYEKVKSDPQLFASYKEAEKRYKQSDAYKESRKEHDERYFSKNRERILAYKSAWSERKRFGTSRAGILFMLGKICALNDSHIEDLVVHHRNGQGRCSDNPDNDPRNLIVLCRSCHMKIHHPSKLTVI